jgi:hypothetical protein
MINVRALMRQVAYVRPDGARMIEVAPHVYVARRFVPLFLRIGAKPRGR